MLSILLAVAVAGSSGNPTNLEMTEQVVTEAFYSLADSLGDAGVRSLAIEMVGDHAGNWLVEQSARSVLSSSGIVVSEFSRSTGSPLVTLRLRTMDLAVTLGNAGRSWVFGSRKVDRTVRCEIAAEILDSTGVVVNAWRCGSEASDRVPYSELAILQGASDQAWLTGGTPTTSGGGILEPIVVTGVVASLIYLFYSSRAE